MMPSKQAPDEELFCAEASGDTDEVRLEWGTDDLVAFSPDAAESLFALEHLWTSWVRCPGSPTSS